MRIALPVWEGRISPVFDAAAVLLLVDHDGRREKRRRDEPLGALSASRRAAKLAELGVEVLVCGAISRPLASMVAGHGIQVLPFIRGDVEDVLRACLGGGLGVPECPPQFRMPGCCGRRRGFGRRWRGA